MKRHNRGASMTLVLLLAMAIPTLPMMAKSSPRDNNTAITADSNSATAAAPANRSDARQDETATTSREGRSERHHRNGKRRAVIIGGTALTGMLVGAHVAGPVGALAGAGIGAGVGMFLSHIF